MQLLDETKVWVGNHAFLFDETYGFLRGPAILSHEKRGDDAHAPADPFGAVHQDTSFRVTPQSFLNEFCSEGEVGGKFCKGKVLDFYLQAFWLEREDVWGWDGDGLGKSG